MSLISKSARSTDNIRPLVLPVHPYIGMKLFSLRRTDNTSTQPAAIRLFLFHRDIHYLFFSHMPSRLVHYYCHDFSDRCIMDLVKVLNSDLTTKLISRNTQ